MVLLLDKDASFNVQNCAIQWVANEEKGSRSEQSADFINDIRERSTFGDLNGTKTAH